MSYESQSQDWFFEYNIATINFRGQGLIYFVPFITVPKL